jgi:hypothetical protein
MYLFSGSYAHAMPDIIVGVGSFSIDTADQDTGARYTIKNIYP